MFLNFRGVAKVASIRAAHQVAKSVHCGLLPDFFEALVPCTNLLRSQDLEETEHFRRWRQEKVAKIVQCGEHYFLSEKRPPRRWPQVFLVIRVLSL